jgi:hypothetical protein
MAHYYVRHMYEPVYPIMIFKFYLANITEVNATTSLYVVSELFNGTHGQLICSIHTLDTFTSRFSLSYSVSMNSSGTQHLADFSYGILMNHFNCVNNNQCIIHCLYNDSQQEVEQTLYLTQPNLHIQSIHQLTPTDFHITLNATRPALFVWLDVPANISGYFSRNGFHMFEFIINVTFHSWTSIEDFDLRMTSLFNVTVS